MEYRADLIKRGMYNDHGNWTQAQADKMQKVSLDIQNRLAEWNEGDKLITRKGMNKIRDKAMLLYLYNKHLFVEAE